MGCVRDDMQKSRGKSAGTCAGLVTPGPMCIFDTSRCPYGSNTEDAEIPTEIIAVTCSLLVFRYVHEDRRPFKADCARNASAIVDVCETQDNQTIFAYSSW